MKKLLFCLLIFISILFIYNNSYAFDDNLQINQTLVNDTFGTNYTYSDNLIFSNNVEEPEEPIQVDLTKISQDLDYIKSFLFLICLYLLCKAIYGVIWWLYNKTLL